MFTKQNLLENITIISCCGLLFSIFISYVTSISPITGTWFVLYSIVTFLCSAIFSFKSIQCLLNLNKPVQYDIQRIFDTYPQISFLLGLMPKALERKTVIKVTEEWKDYDTNELSVISSVLERKLVSSWYVHYISQEIGFPFACKQMLDQMIGKTFQICHNIETKDVAVDLGTILVSHFREYKKALKRHEKNPTSDLESLYKKSHFTSENINKKLGSGEHYTNLIRVILKELVSWELWDTPQIELLARILAKKLDNFIENSLANPIWLNEKILCILNKEHQTSVIKDQKKTENETKKEVQEKIEEQEVFTEPKVVMATIESALSTVITKSTAPILKRPISDEIPNDKLMVSIDSVEDAVLGLEPVNLDRESSPMLRQRRGRQGRNEVKIYDRVIEGSVRTWETDLDLKCISLGQDLLASLDGPITLSRLWEQEDPDGSPNPQPSKDGSLWFGEEDTIDIDLESNSKEPSPVKKEHSPKPAELLKELQSTVNQAKNKFGDLQVDSRTIDVPPKQYSGDEAAGMMEGLLDFGIARFKKGLRLTGLSDDLDKSPSHQKDKSSPTENKRSIDETKSETPDTQRDENGINAVHTLVKQQRVISQDSVPIPIKPLSEEFPELGLSDSPEPEYEEAADLSTSIAKLRHLLLRADCSPPKNDVTNDKGVWWDFAEETRGRTQQHHSSKPVDTATFADEYDMNAERNTSPVETSNNMQKLDKFFYRTVTGMFNSIKTAVGGDAEDDDASLPTSPTQEWTYVCTDIEQSVGGAVARFVGSRRAHSHVDAALDSLQQIPSETPVVVPALPPDDFEEWCGLYGAGWCVCCELAASVGLCPSHVSHRLLLLFADVAESLIDEWLEELTTWIKEQVFVIFEDLSRRMESEKEEIEAEKGHKNCDVEDVCEAIVAQIPALYIVGEDNLKSSVRFALASFGHKELNKDVIFRTLDILTLHFKNAAKVRNPSFDVN